MNWVAGALAVGLGGYLSILVAMFALEPRLVFPAPQLDPGWLESQARLAGAEELRLTTPDGETLYGWFLPADGPRAVLFFSGNATSVGLDPSAYRRWRDQGVSVLHVNYRGYPLSTGTPSEAGLRTDAETAWRWLTTRYSADDIVIVGRSLGGGVAVGLAATVQPRGLLLLATYSAAVQVARDSYSWLPVGLLMRNRFDSAALAPQVSAPAVIVHGRADTMIGPHHPTTLAAAFAQPPPVLWVDGAAHNDPLLTDPDAWQAALALTR